MTAFCDAATQFYCVNEDYGRPSRRSTIPGLFLMLTLFCMIAAAPGMACLHATSLDAVDDALSKHSLSSRDQDNAMQLRAKMAELLNQDNERAATEVEAQIMDIMGLKLERARGSCGHWVPKGK